MSNSAHVSATVFGTPNLAGDDITCDRQYKQQRGSTLRLTDSLCLAGACNLQMGPHFVADTIPLVFLYVTVN